MISCDMARYRWDGEELQGEILDAGFGFPVNKKVGIYYTVIDICKMSS